jgi:DNA-binding NarL/FixJ family response regulator
MYFSLRCVMKGKSLHILLVDDHNLCRKALCSLVRSFSPSYIIHEACNGREALAVLARKPVNIILLDNQMPSMGGLETLKQIREDGRNTKVIMLTQFEEKSLIFYSFLLGANGFLSKSCDPLELMQAINEVSTKGHYYNALALDALNQNFSNGENFSKLNMTPREYQVLVLLKEGKSNKDIARNLGLTLRTIESYRKKLIKKTGSRNTVDLVSLGYRTGILGHS